MKRTLFILSLVSTSFFIACSNNTNTVDDGKIQENEQIIQESEDDLLNQIEADEADSTSTDSSAIKNDASQTNNQDVIDFNITTKK
ncbi:MAG: hypothetical protein KF882_01115 [Bacteroidia bacterium]|nr:hypothetical protein [Bacteroidia bacterium]MCO5253307.1 hypothetical protein [Bacteroidota bacterium]